MTMEQIRSRRKQVLVLFYYKDLPTKAIAEDLGLNIRSVQRIISDNRDEDRVEVKYKKVIA